MKFATHTLPSSFSCFRKTAALIREREIRNDAVAGREDRGPQAEKAMRAEV